MRDGRRSPPAGPRATRRPRSRSPARFEGRYENQPADTWRRRSLSPPRDPRPEYRSEQSSGRASASTSRRSSPPIHPGRLALQQPNTAPPNTDERSPAWRGGPPPRGPAAGPLPSTYRQRSPIRERSPPRRAWSPRPRSPRETGSYRSPPRRRESPPPRDDAFQKDGIANDARSPAPLNAPSGPSYRNGDRNAGFYNPPPLDEPRDLVSPSNASPSAASSTPMQMSAHNRMAPVSVLAAPSHPRNGPGPGSRYAREGSRDGSFSGYPPRRAPSFSQHPYSRGPNRTPSSFAHGGPRPPREASPGSIPTGPRSSYSSGPPPPFAGGGGMRASNNSTSTTYPRTQHFNHLSTVPAIVPGGKLLPSNLKPEVLEKLAKLEEEKRKIEEQLAEKLAKKRVGLREWEKLERESAREALKSDLAEQQLRVLTDDGGLGGAAF
ncbi:MAG: hypothetical protein M1819_001535 [Sarea resinae]|nr:MAG: hypothetical protein M1819_001535 [Sarea resinae]